MISVKNIRGAVQKKEAPQKPRKEDDDCDTCVFVCVHVCVCLCVCLYDMVTFDDAGGGSQQRRQVAPARAAAAVGLFKN